MYTEIQTTKKGRQFTTERVNSLPEMAEMVRYNAINQARKKLAPQVQQDKLANLLERHDFIEYFKHSLSHEIAQLFGTYNQHVQVVYLFDESINPDAETEDFLPQIDLTIHLLLRVSSKSAALEMFTTSFERALTEVLRQMPSAAFAGYRSFLDVIPITERAIQERRGYAVLLSSIYARPLEVWSRQ